MTSKEIINYIEKEGIDKLYKKFEKYFIIVDQWEDKLIEGDLLNEYELAYAHDQLQGIYGKCYPISQVIESYIESRKANTKLLEHAKLEKYRTQDSTILNARADSSVSELNNYYKDFDSCAKVCSQLAIGCQSRMKRLTVDKGLKGIDFTGETVKAVESETIKKENQGW